MTSEITARIWLTILVAEALAAIAYLTYLVGAP